MPDNKSLLDLRSGYGEQFGFAVDAKDVNNTGKGLSREVVETISRIKQEPQWMLDFRLKALEIFMKKPMPTWGADLSKIIFENITYYVSATEGKAKSWEDLPEGVRNTFDRLGIPEAEKNFLAGVEAQFDSEVVYSKVREDLEKLGVVFCSTDEALKKYPELLKKYFATIVPPDDNKFAALNLAVWSGGSFVYIPKGVEVPIPLQAYFRINSSNMGQFERTLIIADEGSKVHYIEGCLPEWEVVSTGEEMVSITKIKENDVVINSEGEETSVEKTMVRPYDGELIEIIPVSTGNKFHLTTEHPVLAIRRENVASNRPTRKFGDIQKGKLMKAKPEFIPAAELKEGDLLIFPVNKVSRNDNSISKELVAFLGYYLSEGNVSKINGCDAVVMTFHEKERDYINEAKNLVETLIGKIPSEFHAKDKHAITLTVYSKELAELCVKHCGKYSHGKKLSKSIMELPPKRQKLLIDTYYNGDGSVAIGKPTRIRALTVSRTLAFQMQELLARQGIYACINIRKPYEEKMKDGRLIKHRQKYTLFYATDRHSENVKLINGSFIVPIRKIRRQNYKGNVYNFHVDREPNTYLVKGFAVHNCTAPKFSADSLHSAVVEVIALEGAHVRYTTLQNWWNNVYNLVTKRAFAHKNAYVEWLDANIGSKITMKYPSVFLLGEGAKADMMSIAFAGKGQQQDAGAKAIHMAKNTRSTIISKSISKDGGKTTYRGLVRVDKGCTGVKSNVRCDALLLDEKSVSDTVPYMEIEEKKVSIGHEATVGRVNEEQLFYLMSRGLTEQEATALIVRGFFECFTKQLPLEYAVEFNRLIELEMEGSVG